jgi:hypothetical protein
MRRCLLDVVNILGRSFCCLTLVLVIASPPVDSKGTLTILKRYRQLLALHNRLVSIYGEGTHRVFMVDHVPLCMRSLLRFCAFDVCPVPYTRNRCTGQVSRQEVHRQHRRTLSAEASASVGIVFR